MDFYHVLIAEKKGDDPKEGENEKRVVMKKFIKIKFRTDQID
jgi:hypothetical protein